MLPKRPRFSVPLSVLDVWLRVREPISIVLGFSLFIGIFLAFISIPSASELIRGTSVRLAAIQSDVGAQLLMVVQLSDGTLVRVPVERSSIFLPNKEVELLKSTSSSGSTSFSFVRYTQDQHNSSVEQDRPKAALLGFLRFAPASRRVFLQRR